MKTIRLFLLLILILMTGCASKADKAKKLNNEGVQFYQSHNNAMAIQRFTKALELNPSCADAYYNLGLINFEQRNLPLAIAMYEKAIKTGPESEWYHLNLAIAQEQQGSHNEAIKHYERAIQLKPEFAEAYNNMGVIQGNLGKTDEAIAAYRKAAELKPDYYEALYNLGLSLMSRKQYKEALDSLAGAAKINDRDPFLYFYQGSCYARMGENGNALDALEKAIDKGMGGFETIGRYSPEFNALRKEKRFAELLEKSRAAESKKPVKEKERK
ncbi:MAG: tetratricopeptide repeat protein [Candidatus Xenobiia bacterium LiM19]